MEVIINENKEEVAAVCTLQQIADYKLGDKQKGIAIALNDKVIAKNEWQQIILKPNDKILIIKATQGG